MNIAKLIGETTEYEKKLVLEKKKPKSWCKSVSAFANGMGGKLIFGISDNDEIVGLDNAEKDADIISEQIKVRLDPIPNFNLKFIIVKGDRKLIILDIYPGEQTPYYYVADGSLIAYYRLGNQSLPVSPEKLKELVLRGSSYSYDSLKSQYSFKDMAFTKLKSIYKQRTGLEFEDLDYESFGIVDKDKNLTNAGALLADESPVRHSRLFCTKWNGLDKAPGVIDAIDDKEYTGGLINLLQDGINFINNNSKKSWKKSGDRRIEMPDYPERAITETLVNALIHRNYLEVGSEVHIDIFDDRMEVYSPGGMYDGIKIQDRDIMNIPSRRRNPIIADVFNRLNYMERRGSGFKKILADYKNHPNYRDNLIPVFSSESDSFLLILKNLNYKKQAIKTGDKKQAIKTGDKKQAIKTEDHMEKIIEFIELNGDSKTKDISNYIDLSVSRTRAILSLMDEVEAVGEYRARIYRLKK